MSLDARLRQGFIATAEAFDINAELELINVQAAARVRERRHVLVAAFAGAAAAALLLVAGPRVADLVLGIEIPKPFNPAVPDNSEDEVAEEEVKTPRFDPEDVRKAEELAERRQQQVESRRRPVAIAGAPTRVGPIEDVRTRESGPSAVSQGEIPRHQPADPRYRSVSQDYQAAGIDADGVYNCPSDPGNDLGCVEFQARSYERYLSLNIRDEVSSGVAAVVGIDANRNGKIDDNFEICGATDGFVRIPAGARIEIQLFTDNDACGAGNSPTRGRVVAIFSDRRS